MIWDTERALATPPDYNYLHSFEELGNNSYIFALFFSSLHVSTHPHLQITELWWDMSPAGESVFCGH